MISALEQYVNGYPETNHFLDTERLYKAVISKRNEDIYKSIEDLKILLSNKPFNENQKGKIVSDFENLWYFQKFLTENGYFQ